MNEFGYAKKNSEESIQSMLGELKQFLERDTNSETEARSSNGSQVTTEVSQSQYFTFLGSSNTMSVMAESPTADAKKYNSLNIGEFFKIKERGTSSMSSKISNLERKAVPKINQNLKHKISDKILNL
jgi:hypothetical protein